VNAVIENYDDPSSLVDHIANMDDELDVDVFNVPLYMAATTFIPTRKANPHRIHRGKTWDENYNLSMIHGTVSGSFIVRGLERDVKLGLWQLNQISYKNNGQLSAEDIAKLELIPGWEWDRQAAKWNEKYAISMIIGAVSQKHVTVDGVKVGQWQVDQKVYKKAGSLSPGRIARCEKIPGWKWAKPKVESEQ
jgi:hypothetical protein